MKTVGGRLIVRQPPGLDNALGRVAFMFPNDYSVYLHDTPAQALFDEDMRALSHGCVRVEDPLRLAELVLGWSQERIDAAIGGPERTVFLPRPLPIHIEYFTEFVDEFGELQERPDVYGLAQKVAGILSAITSRLKCLRYRSIRRKEDLLCPVARVSQNRKPAGQCARKDAAPSDATAGRECRTRRVERV